MNTLFQQAIQFIKEAIAELKKVTWLSKKEVVASTIILIILVVVIAIFVGSVDLLLSRAIGILL